jgi:hypothetical protein
MALDADAILLLYSSISNANAKQTSSTASKTLFESHGRESYHRSTLALYGE